MSLGAQGDENFEAKQSIRFGWICCASLEGCGSKKGYPPEENTLVKGNMFAKPLVPPLVSFDGRPDDGECPNKQVYQTVYQFWNSSLG